MKKRGLIFVTVMSIVTFGIYDIYWLISTRNELVKRGQNILTPWVFLAPVLGLIAVGIMQLIAHNLLTASSSSAITTLNVISVIIGIISVLTIVPLAIYFTWQYSKAVGVVTKDALTAELCFVVALVTNVMGFWFIWPIVVQYYFNQETALASSKGRRVHQGRR